MWANNLHRNETSLLGLIASDFAYKKALDIVFDKNDPTKGEFLASLPDSRASDEYSFPRMVAGMSSDPSMANFATRTEVNGVGLVIMPNWQAFNVIEQSTTGFGVVIFRGVYSNGGQIQTDYILAFRGTDGRDGKDWLANIQLGRNQWQGAMDDVSDALQTLTNADGSPFSGTIHFTGQSLGGALAQYAAYEYARVLGDSFRADRATLTTFNAFAAGAGLRKIHG